MRPWGEGSRGFACGVALGFISFALEECEIMLLSLKF